MKSRFAQSGYLINDNRASGGLREEDDILACNHCSALLRASEWKRAGGYCTGCDKPLCTRCLSEVGRTGCVPEVARLERAIADDYRRRQNARVCGT